LTYKPSKVLIIGKKIVILNGVKNPFSTRMVTDASLRSSMTVALTT